MTYFGRGHSLKKIGLFPHLKKTPVYNRTHELIEILQSEGFQVLMEEGTAAYLGREDLGHENKKLLETIDCGIVLGGDGALLYVARLIYPRQIPIFGVNFGHLGFLTEVDDQCLAESVSRLRAGRFFLEDRLIVGAEVVREGQVAEAFVALNDIVITKGAFARMLRLKLKINGQSAAAFPSDGLIISTPTGSTAYSLSAGGPVIDPSLAVLLLTPICAHSLFARPLVIGGEAQVEVEFSSTTNDLMLTADGQEGAVLQNGDVVRCFTAPCPTKLVRFERENIYHLLQARSNEGRI